MNKHTDMTPEQKARELDRAAVRDLPFDGRRFASDRAYRAEYRAARAAAKEEARARMSPEERQAAEERERQRELKRPCPYCGERGERELSR